MDLEGFLHANRLSIDSVLHCVDSKLRLESDEVLYAAGSLTEGLGTVSSDVDLTLLTARNDLPCTHPGVAVIQCNAILLDVAIVDIEFAQSLIDKLAMFGQSSGDARNAGEFNAKELKFLHRLAHGLPLFGVDGFTQWRRQIDLSALSRQKFENAFHEIKCLSVDLAGLERECDLHSMLLAAELMLDHGADALLAGFGWTNPNPKWRARLLAKLPNDWSKLLPGAHYEGSAKSAYFALRALPRTITEQVATAYCARISSFCRQMIMWGTWLFYSNSSTGPRPGSLHKNSLYSASALPRLPNQVFIVFENKGFSAFNLDTGVCSLPLTIEEAEFLAAYDLGSIQRTLVPHSICELAEALGAAHQNRDLEAELRLLLG